MMTVLNIYSLDDTEHQNVIASLPEGKHVIGRGDLLHVTDKRVSRKHAVIEISNGNITLTSVHVNPCFFKAVNGRTMTVITQNQINELNDGDQFALLPEDYWFRVKIKIEDQEGPPINGKRLHQTNLEEHNLHSDTKRARLSTGSDQNDTNNPENCPSTSKITEQIPNHSHNNASLYNDDNECTKEIPELNHDDSDSSLHHQETARIEDIELEDQLIKEEAQEIDECLMVLADIASQNSTAEQDNERPEIKTENIDNENNDLVDDTSHNPTAAQDNAQPEIKTENNRDEIKTGASGSGSSGSGPAPQAGPRTVRRERCWYGDKCFRKNPNHRVAFSHPGDPDFEPDPEDDRPDCPFGMTCYRKNTQHRLDYKHVGRPAPKPSNVNIALDIRNACPYCQHCNRKSDGGGGGKPDYESDVDDFDY